METIGTKNGLTAKLIDDRTPNDPRDNENLARMVCGHRRYRLGDSARTLGWTFRADDFRGWFDVESHLEIHEDALVVVPLYLYDHSGITMSTGRFSCPWDSGQVGFAYVTNEAAKAAWPSLEGAALVDVARECIEAEVREYDAYLRGDVYGYIIEDETGRELDSCWGYYGHEHAKAAALDALHAFATARPEQLDLPGVMNPA